ncbi:hypothetical protein K0M31_001524 [Melipona bicolor]|uniref:Uncharacterized protein n=1 Tax=Melipona bicolor TaxID=60889 RepID=A0AA40GFP0_9HYME|nr:hypothetical protein K0M31_001524 [Melipona bicolor]
MDRPIRRLLRIKDNGWVRTKGQNEEKESAAMNVAGTQKYATWCATAALSSDSTLLDLWIIKKSGTEELCL